MNTEAAGTSQKMHTHILFYKNIYMKHKHRVITSESSSSIQ